MESGPIFRFSKEVYKEPLQKVAITVILGAMVFGSLNILSLLRRHILLNITPLDVVIIKNNKLVIWM